MIGENEFDSIKSVTFNRIELKPKIRNNFEDKYGSKLKGDLYTYSFPKEDEWLPIKSGLPKEEKVSVSGKIQLSEDDDKWKRRNGYYVEVPSNAKMYYIEGRIHDTHKVKVVMDSGREFDFEYRYNYYTAPISYGELITP